MVASCQMPKTILDPDIDRRTRRFFTDLLAENRREFFATAVLDHQHHHPILREAFPSIPDTYSRSIIARTEQGFEVMIARWSRGMATIVHGHPDYAFYLLLEGQLGVENFVMGRDGLQFTGKHQMEPGDYFSMQGVAGTYDNAIHRISSMADSLSVHIYSDDALKGTCFPEYREVSPFLAACPPERPNGVLS